MAQHPPLSTGPAGPAGAAQEEHQLLLRNATLMDWCWNICMCWVRGCFYNLPWQLLGWRLGWKDCCCCWLLLDLLAIPRTHCSVAVSGVMLPTVPGLHRRKKSRHGKKWPNTLRSPPGQLAQREWHRRSTYCYSRTPQLLDWCWTHVLVGVYWFSLHAVRRRLRAWPGEGVRGAHSWTESSLSTPLAADFGHGLEEAEEGCAAGQRVRFLRLSPPTSGLARMGRRGGAQLDVEFAFLRFSPPTSGLAWIG